jgi:restriction system protein
MQDPDAPDGPPSQSQALVVTQAALRPPAKLHEERLPLLGLAVAADITVTSEGETDASAHARIEISLRLGFVRISFWIEFRVPPDSGDATLLLRTTFTRDVGDAAEGKVIVAVVPTFLAILQELHNFPWKIYQLPPRRFEELIAASYERDGWEAVLTPRSGDGGFDVMATKRGFGALRVIEQVKAYAPDRRVTADEVRALVGVLGSKLDTSKGIVTTTGEFAPRLKDDPYLKLLMPYRLELRSVPELLDWFDRLLLRAPKLQMETDPGTPVADG